MPTEKLETYVGKNLRYLLKVNDLSGQRFSKLFSVSPQAVSGWLSGSSYPRFETLIQIVTHFDINLHEFVFTDYSVTGSGAYVSEIEDLKRRVAKLEEDYKLL